MAVRSDDQLALDEEVVENPDAEAALIERQARKDALGAVRKEFKEAHERAVAALALLELPEEGAVRIGRFRINKSIVSARSVSFETAESSRLRITLLGEQTTLPTPAGDDDADVRPTGEVNADALRGEAERATGGDTGLRRVK